jgi:hypothetical protein
MKVDLSTELDCSATKAWNEVQKSALLLHVIWPLARISTSGLPDLPGHWREGQKVQCCVYVFGQGADLLEKRGWDDRPGGVSFASYSASRSLRTAAI